MVLKVAVRLIRAAIELQCTGCCAFESPENVIYSLAVLCVTGLQGGCLAFRVGLCGVYYSRASSPVFMNCPPYE